MSFSIIIPTLNEASGIVACLSALQPLRAGACEIIAVDGGSHDNTAALASPLVDKLVYSRAGRARQMNAGAQQATGHILVFLHADTFLPDDALKLIRTALAGVPQWGWFDVELVGQPFMLSVIAFMMNRRSRLTGIATGDQTLFMTRAAFTAAGGYPDIALMEDVALCKALNKLGPPAPISAKARSSGRRWEQFGVFSTILLMWWLRLRYWLGAEPAVLAECYAQGRLWKQ